MADGGEQREIGLVLYPGAQQAAIHGLTDLFFIANRNSMRAEPHGRAPLRVTHWSVRRDEIACTYCSEPSATPKPEYLIVPPTLADMPDMDTSAAIGRWLRQQHDQGVALVSICSGIFLVAATGLLDGRMASTHRVCARALTDSFPNVSVDTEQRMIEHPNILTAGGFMAWVDVAFVLIEKLVGVTARAEMAAFVLPGHAADADANFTRLASRGAHGDPAVRKAVEFVHMRDGRDVSLASMAAAARLERRTFLRRFRSATGMTPVEYSRAVRIARAREFLEAGNMPLKTLAETLGYMDLSSFARAFRRSCGVSPGAYRNLHGGAFEGYDTEHSRPIEARVTRRSGANAR